MSVRGLLCGALLAMVPAASLAAQDQAAIAIGENLQQRLDPDGPRMSGRGPFRVHRIRLRAGDVIVATLRASDFDAHLSVARVVGGVTDLLKSDDDSGEGTDARLRFRAAEEDDYLLIAQSVAQDGAGGYTLSVARAPQPTTAHRRDLRPGETAAGRLEETDAVLEEDDTYYDLFLLRGEPGTRVTVRMQSSAFDAYLAAGRGPDGDFRPEFSNDDDGGGRDARMRVTFPPSGELLVRANSVGVGVGAYTLLVGQPSAPVDHPTEIAAGQEVAGTLSDDDDALTNGAFYDEWSFTARGGDTIRVSLSTGSFDALLFVGRGSGASFVELARDDDGGEGTGSMLELPVPDSGPITIRATSLSGGSVGEYRLRVERVN